MKKEKKKIDKKIDKGQNNNKIDEKKELPPRKEIEIVLYEISSYNKIPFSKLEDLKQQNLSLFDYFIIGPVPYACYCDGNCNCPREQPAFKGVRQENEKEYEERVAKEAQDTRERTEQQEKYEKATLNALLKKYKISPLTNEIILETP